ncbi:MAG TPA: FMN-binding protein [Streptosporangiaceae bacterium]|nr:FMN-binding protein [Streptosporangiaceae bacterium]
MRRVILAVTGTIAGLVALLSFKSHDPTMPVAATTGTGGGSTTSSSSSSSSSATTIPGEFRSVAGTLTTGETTITGKVANTVYGPVQIQLVVKNSKIVKVAVLEQPTNTIHDIQIGEFAFPRLISETLAAQNAKIDAVSGASYTSAGYISSLQSAVDHGL